MITFSGYIVSISLSSSETIATSLGSRGSAFVIFKETAPLFSPALVAYLDMDGPSINS